MLSPFLRHKTLIAGVIVSALLAVAHTVSDPSSQSCTMSSPAAKLVTEAINSHKVVVFSKTYCPYCVKAKRALGQFLKPDAMFVMEVSDHARSYEFLAVKCGPCAEHVVVRWPPLTRDTVMTV